jgi:hypothetical protein
MSQRVAVYTLSEVALLDDLQAAPPSAVQNPPMSSSVVFTRNSPRHSTTACPADLSLSAANRNPRIVAG